ncbi:uncharacterized protein BDR25DRAFT_328788 [Lindgomyces ingoldianus]|uniref:Uncharacterized protein n=1 Tax=Lindgomyces ingoldianus TaxID=673940 RepID=A0ACB6QGA5_9PLEO|nr:uncharacterized protein BDR25DRAFT_328788 [Lindgomyces ingoldianus]KAF2465185.1 hypothetical protein BDR25DRAFT_328788 [Lindgomyces ingoldianus]
MHLSEEQIIMTFDQLAREVVLGYGPYESVRLECDGYPLEFRICPTLSRKPNAIGKMLDASFDLSRRWSPGSDRLKITVLNNTHDLSVNLFCVDRPQLLLLTLDSYRRQHEPLDSDDFNAALTLIRDPPSIFGIFIGGGAAGCSRVRKHMQGLRGPPFAFDLFTSEDKKTIPFKFYSHQFVDGLGVTTASDPVEMYEVLLRQSRDALSSYGLQETEPSSANAGGMMGSIWVSEKRVADAWAELGYRNVFETLGVPR